MPPVTGSASNATKSQSSTAHGGAQDAVALLKADHRKVEQIFAQFDGAGSNEDKHRLVRQVCKELIVHTLIEEEIFYPACRDKGVEDSLLNEAQVEHDGAKTLIAELIQGNPQEEYYDAKVKVLAAYIAHHVRDEEKPRSGILAKAKAAGVDMAALGQKLEARKRALMDRIREDRLEPPAPRAFHQPQPRSQETYMASQSNYRERDERGRFIEDDDDDRRGGGYSSRGRDEEGRFTSGRRYARDDDDERGHGRGGWYGDREGHSQAARQRGSYSRGRYDEDDNGRGHGRGGWSGDPEGHSEASRRGWEHSGHEGSGWYGDPRGHSQASRRGWERSDHEGSGWYGDSEGHARASREGWEERGSMRGRSRSRDYDEDDDRRRGHGGWYGDRGGHSEASRRGWEDR